MATIKEIISIIVDLGLIEFPGFNEFGLNVEDESCKYLALALANMCLAYNQWPEFGTDSVAFDMLEKMISRGHVDIADIKKAVGVYKMSQEPE